MIHLNATHGTVVLILNVYDVLNRKWTLDLSQPDDIINFINIVLLGLDRPVNKKDAHIRTKFIYRVNYYIWEQLKGSCHQNHSHTHQKLVIFDPKSTNFSRYAFGKIFRRVRHGRMLFNYSTRDNIIVDSPWVAL